MSLKTPGKKQSPPTALKTKDEGSSEEIHSLQDEYKNDILVSLKELKAGEVIDAAESMREIRRELGINGD
ncbi:MAG: hypothetical protein OXG49_05865 [Chloroflexi bacterium]|nr:hypothetical protein [Chloroflexota bacterium]